MESWEQNSDLTQWKISASAPQLIPVCIPVNTCQLLHDDTCLNGQTCAIVRADGTTSCVEPGLGHDGDPCSCAAGFTCSKITNTCLKLCDTTTSSIPRADPAAVARVVRRPIPKTSASARPTDPR